MSKENAKKFAEELMNSEKLQKQLKAENPKTLADVAAFAAAHKFSFTAKELKDTIDEFKGMQLSDEVLDKIYAGAYPTAVNNQITDSIT